MNKLLIDGLRPSGPKVLIAVPWALWRTDFYHGECELMPTQYKHLALMAYNFRKYGFCMMMSSHADSWYYRGFFNG